MYRIALMIPHSDTTLETDLQMNLPKDFILHTQRIWLDEVSKEAEQKMVDFGLPEAIRYLKGITKFSSAVFGCTSASVVYGEEGMQEIENSMAREFGCPSITAFGSVMKEINKLGASKIVLFTPYTLEVNEFVRENFEAFGVQVAYDNGMGYLNDVDIGEILPERVYEFILSYKEQLEELNADLCFISCTNLRSMEIREALERELNIPVLTSNYCVYRFIMNNMT